MQHIDGLVEHIDVLAPKIEFLVPHLDQLIPHLEEILPYSEVLVSNFGTTLPYVHNFIGASAPLLPAIGKLSKKITQFTSPGVPSEEQTPVTQQRRRSLENEPSEKKLEGMETTPVDHAFLLTHFNRPTWCDYCKKFIWSPVGKQGLQCKSK
jgi:hypothetical protein